MKNFDLTRTSFEEASTRSYFKYASTVEGGPVSNVTQVSQAEKGGGQNNYESNTLPLLNLATKSSEKKQYY